MFKTSYLKLLFKFREIFFLNKELLVDRTGYCWGRTDTLIQFKNVFKKYKLLSTDESMHSCGCKHFFQSTTQECIRRLYRIHTVPLQWPSCVVQEAAGDTGRSWAQSKHIKQTVCRSKIAPPAGEVFYLPGWIDRDYLMYAHYTASKITVLTAVNTNDLSRKKSSRT